MTKGLLVASIGAAATSLAAAAQAETLPFNYSASGGYDPSFEQSSYATPISSNSGSFNSVDGYSPRLYGGSVIDDIGLNEFGPQTYSGMERDPVFAPGVSVGHDQGNRLTTALTVSLVSALPDPAKWALMIIGLGMLGGGLRARKAALADA